MKEYGSCRKRDKDSKKRKEGGRRTHKEEKGKKKERDIY